ncbi:MAG: hypothetical protein QME96_06210 [Myxococcota bacterium]|nr:hypothetical protein [Myxococcota bacterium]
MEFDIDIDIDIVVGLLAKQVRVYPNSGGRGRVAGGARIPLYRYGCRQKASSWS